MLFCQCWGPQGSVLGPTLFLLFINDLPDHILCKLAIYADDSTLYSCLEKSAKMFDKVEMAAETWIWSSVCCWMGVRKWQVTFNSTKTKLLLINHFREPFLPPVSMNGSNLPESDSFRLLGMILSQDFSWRTYIESIAKFSAMKVGSLLHARSYLTPESILNLYKTSIHPCIEYCCHILDGAPSDCLSLLDRI